MIKVESDPEFFRQLMNMKFKIQGLASMFNQEDKVITYEEWDQWNDCMHKFKKEMSQLLMEADMRMKPHYEG